jgi:hypothetical protein
MKLNMPMMAKKALWRCVLFVRMAANVPSEVGGIFTFTYWYIRDQPEVCVSRSLPSFNLSCLLELKWVSLEFKHM